MNIQDILKTEDISIIKTLSIFLLGIIVLFFQISFLNFIPTYIPNLVLIYVILCALYSNDILFPAIALIIGLFLDMFTGKYIGIIALLFFVLSLILLFIHNKIEKKYFMPAFTISVISVFLESLCSYIVYHDIVFSIYFVKNFFIKSIPTTLSTCGVSLIFIIIITFLIKNKY